MYRRFGSLALALAFALPLVAAEEPDWRDILVRFTVGTEGELHVTDRLQVDVPPEVQKLERYYWTDAEQHVKLDRILRVEPNGSSVELRPGSLDMDGHYDVPTDGKIVWSTRDASAKPAALRPMTYIVETTVSGAVVPSWSMSRGKQTLDDQHQLAQPKQRLRALLAQWRRAKRDRYLLDYQYEMPPASTTGTTIQLELYWPAGWIPVDDITGDTIARPLERDFYNPDSWRVTHFFDVRGPAPVDVDVRRHALRMLSIVGFPIAALLLFAFFVVRELIVRRRPANAAAADEAPEVIAARWSGKPSYPSIEAFLRRLEKQRKLSIDIERRGEDEVPLVHLRLLVPREKLTPYERAGIDELIPDGFDITSEDIQRRHEGTDFDPTIVLYEYLKKVAAEAKQKAPWYSRLTSFAIFLAGVALLAMESLRLGREPAALAAALIAASVLTRLWPDDLARIVVRARPAGMLVMLVPIALAMAVIVAINVAGELPLGIYAASGLSLVMLAVVKAVLAAHATRGPAAISPPRTTEPVPDEDWGEALMT